jgi:hypothetical protein
MTNIVTPSAELYLCSRTSAYNPQPCEEAYRVLVMQVDRRSYDDPKKSPRTMGLMVGGTPRARTTAWRMGRYVVIGVCGRNGLFTCPTWWHCKHSWTSTTGA